jgi:hypothetical protein
MPGRRKELVWLRLLHSCCALAVLMSDLLFQQAAHPRYRRPHLVWRSAAHMIARRH